MVADPMLEQRLRQDLRAQLDGAVGPHPTWAESPVARRIREDGVDGLADRRRIRRSTLLLAAAVSVVALTGALVVGGTFQQRTQNPPAVPPTPSPSVAASLAAVVPEPSTGPLATPSAALCQTSWSHTGTKSPVGLVDGVRIDEFGGGGELFMLFPHGLDTVQRILIEPAQPPFRTSAGTRVNVAGSAFFRLTIDGLTKPTPVDDRMVAGKHAPPYLPTVSLPIAEMRRLWKPAYRSPIVGPGRHSTEVWAIGLSGPSCIRVRTARDGYTADEPGDNVLIIHFDANPVRNPMPIPEPILLPSPSPGP